MRMLRAVGFLIALLSWSPPADAMHLTWSSGGSELSISQATRCTILVQTPPDSFPQEWRIHWVTANCVVSPVPAEPQPGSSSGTAWLCGLDLPSTPSLIAANQTTAHYCRDGAITQASFIVDISSSGSGKFQAFAIDPDDSTEVLASNEIRFNGGVTAAFTPAVLRASFQHDAADLGFELIGAGLDTVTSTVLTASDQSWELALAPTTQTSSRMTLSVSAVAPVPNCDLNVMTAAGRMGTRSVEAEPVSVEAPQLTGYASFSDPVSGYYPKDHAIILVNGKYHILYTRGHSNSANDGKSFGHATSNDLQHWTIESTNIMPVRDGVHHVETNWDYSGVWAPHIIKKPDDMNFYMFYTGVTSPATNSVQKIGFAQSTDLVVWTRRDAPVLDATKASWAASNPTIFNGEIYPGREFRDPFVMPDPLQPGKWLMYFVAVRALDNSFVTGVARTNSLTGTIDDWSVLTDPLRHTGIYNQHQQPNARIESPHVFFSRGKWWMGFTTAGDSKGYLRLSENPVKPYDQADSDSANWNNTAWSPYFSSYYNFGLPLRTFLGDDTSVQQWFASEYLRVPGDEYPGTKYEYMTAVDGGSLYISQINWSDNDHFLLTVPVSDAGDESTPVQLAMRLIGFRPGQTRVQFALDVPATSHLRLSIFDAAGRRVATILNRTVTAGTVRATWDGRQESGSAGASGVYFARLESPFGGRVLRVPLVR